MKKLLSAISFILCVSMLAVGASAAGATTQEDPYDIYNKCLEVTGAANTFEIKMASRLTDVTSNPPDATVIAASYKLAATPGDNSNFQGEILAWESSEEYLVRAYMKDGYSYDTLSRKKKPEETNRNNLQDMLLTITNMSVSGLTAEKLPGGGYRLRHKKEDDGYSRYTLIINSDYTLKSVSFYGKDDDYIISYIYDFTINGPVTIEFPYDLYSYKTA